jgi:ABC-type lipoprotein release transport system permease subunit
MHTLGLILGIVGIVLGVILGIVQLVSLIAYFATVGTLGSYYTG